MRYLLALILPPVAVLFCGKPVQTVLNFLLTLCFIVPGVVHALLVVNKYYADRRHAELMSAMMARR